MNDHDTRKPSLDTVLDSIRNDEPSRSEIDAAADRVRAALGLSQLAEGSPIHIESCAGFQALIPAFLAGRLPGETALLLEDHSRECIPCRRALIAARTPRTPRAIPTEPTGASSRRPALVKWAAAAAVAAAAVLGAYTAWQLGPLAGGDPQLKVMRVDGSLYQLASGALVPLRPGMKVSAKNAVRTAKDSGALVMMDDGSRIEMRERTEVAVAKRRDGSTVRLGGGAIIVEASPQGSGHLDVRTDDCLVAVKGTIFSVNAGTKGSRVSVVEGAVRVAADGRESLLKPGQQMSTSDAVTAVSVGDEIAWSKDAQRYEQLLKEIADLTKDLDARVPKPGLRYDSRILDRMPDGTILYAAIPNLTDSLVKAKEVFEEHVAQSGALQAWWDEHMSSPENKKHMDEAFAKIKVLGAQLGNEIVIALTRTGDGRVHGPILMSEVKDKSEFKRTLYREMKGQKVDATMNFEGSLVRIEFENHDDAGGTTVPTKVRSTVPSWNDSPLRDKLAASYADGTSWLFGVDLKSMLAAATDQARAHHEDEGKVARHFETMGVLDAESIIVERTENADGAEMRCEITFDHPRRGIAGWLEAPAPMTAAEFISPDAAFAAAAVVKRPEALFAEALEWMGPDAESIDTAGDLQSLQGLAATLGGEIAIALDGPVLPVPSWKLVVEVYDPIAFQTEFTNLVNRINGHLAEHGQEGRVVLESEVVGNRTDWIVRFTGSQEVNGAASMRYTIVDGYLIAAPSRALIDLAIEQRGNGYMLTRSAAFTSLLPADGHVNVSAFGWEHMGPTVGPLASRLGSALASDEVKQLEAMAGESRPRLVTAYAEDDRILISSRGDSGLGALLGSIISAHSLGAFAHALDAARANAGGAISK
jgi:ferric-dicitrate binding protein FerR (iron transport regulator)